MRNKFTVRHLQFLIICISFFFSLTENWELNTGNCAAQTLNLNQFGIEEGLPQSSIYTMLQDKEGNIWVGTMMGVSKYNGLNFENFNKKNGLSENRVTSSCLDQNGNIWFGHWSGGISKYDAVKKQFEEIIPGEIENTKTVNCILQDKHGIIWFGTEGQGIIKYQSGKFTQLTTKEGLAGDAVTALMEDKNSTIWVGTATGISLIKGNIASCPIPLPSKSIRSLLPDSKGNIWVGSTDKGVFRIDSDNKMKVYNTSNGLAEDHIRVIFEDLKGTIFFGTYGGGVSKYLPQLEANNYKGSPFQTISSKHGLSNDRVLSIMQDREKNIWIGTFLNLNQYFDEQFEIYGINEGLDNSLVWSVIQDKKGNLWIGTEGGLIEFSQGKDNTSSAGAFHFNKHTGKKGEILNTSALYEDNKGNIWYTDFGKGLSRLNPSTKKIDTYNVQNNKLPVNEIYSIAGDADGNIWIGTNKSGILIFDIKTEKFEQITVGNGIGSNQVYTIFRDSKNRMWLGTLSGNLTVYEGRVFKTFSEQEGYSSQFTLCITEDNKRNIWLGTYDQGIYKYNGNTFKNYTTKDGLSSNTPFLLAADDKNNLWIGSGLGVDRFNLNDETFKHYEKEDGFLGVEINPNAVCKDTDGALWFGSIIGLVRYNSKMEKNNQVESITTIKNPRIFFEQAEIPENHIFSWNQNHFTFDFIGTSLTNPKRVKYRYMLEGVDKEESPIVKESSITYPDLDPGEYTFKVRSSNNDGVWNASPVIFQFTITPPFWKTTWFWLLVAAALISLVILFIKLRERKLKQENFILERKVTERTEVISAQNAELERKNEKITDSINYAKRIQHAVFIAAEEINKYPFKHFILFKPKDVVSGDFYWSYKKDDNNYFLAVADCTGHGVPGAFMSLIGYNMLNYSIKDLGLETPSSVLSMLRTLIRSTLKNSMEDNKAIRDGMTIAFFHMDIRKMRLHFAGSYNPLYHIRNGLLTEYKGNRIPIAHTENDDQYTDNFTDHIMEIKKGDSIYVFSDGYVDQIGGEKRNKFFYAPFKELLRSIHTQPMNEQKEKLDRTISDWMGSREQLDDITVIGVQF